MLRFITLSVILSMTYSTYGQIFDYQQPAKSFSFGPRVGFTTSTVTGNDLQRKKIRFNYVLGIFTRYQLDQKWALETQVNFANRGVNLNPTGTFGFLEVPVYDDLELAYLDIPVLANFSFKYRLLGKEISSEIKGGLQASFLVDASSGDFDVKDQLNQVDAAFVFGGGIKLGRVLLYATTKFGLIDINDSLQTFDDTANINTPKFKSISSEWTLSYRF